MEDYSGNANKDKQKAVAKEKVVEKVVSTEVIVQKKSISRKFKDIIVEADIKSVISHVISDVFWPAAKNMFYDAGSETLKRVLFKDSVSRGRGFGSGPRYDYRTPINRGVVRETPYAPRLERGARLQSRNDIILQSREEAETVLERMNDIIDQYDVVTVADLNNLLGLRSEHTDNKWGWDYLGNIQVRQLRDGYLLDLPPASEIR